MNIFPTTAVVLTVLLTSCSLAPEAAEPEPQRVPLPQTIRYDSIGRFGKHLTAAMLRDFPYGRTRALDSLGFPKPDGELMFPLAAQRELVAQKYDKLRRRLGEVVAQPEHFARVIDVLEGRLAEETRFGDLPLRAVPVAGKDGRGNVKFTGYYAPVLDVRRTPNATYRFPIYRFPNTWSGALPTRADIDTRRVLAGRGLEIAYAADPVDVYYLQLQGSGYVRFQETGETRYLGYAGSNRHRYRSMETALLNRDDLKPHRLDQQYLKRFLKHRPDIRQQVLNANPSYTFFEVRRGEVEGAGQVPLTGGYSIAVDPKIIPLGSTLLAAVPVYGPDGTTTHHEYRLFFAQDTGGKIRGAGHVDVFMGTGDEAARAAGRLHHFGKLWILLPEDPAVVADVNERAPNRVEG